MELERAQIRLTGLEIRDYKNVKHGFLSLENPGSGYEAGILGLCPGRASLPGWGSTYM